MLDGLAMKSSRTGGLLFARQQIETIVDAGLLWLGSGLCDPDISLAANLGLYGAFGLEKPAALNGPQFVAADVLTQPLKVDKAVAQVPDGPGLGVEVDEQKVLALAEQTREASAAGN
jgi:muconate cycloisomerase